MSFLEFGGLFQRTLAPGIEAGLAWSGNLMLSRVEIAPDGVVPLHSHPHAQGGVCLEGEFDLEIDGVTRRLRPGDLYLIPGDTPHAARGVGVPAVALDVFSPVREDYLPVES